MSKSNNTFDNNNTTPQKPLPPGWEKEALRRSLKKAGKQVQVKANRDERPRRKDWINADVDELENTGSLTQERIMPRGERERRQAVMERAKRLQAGLASESASAENGSDSIPDGLRGVVIEVSTGLCRVDMGNRVLLCALRGSLSAESTGFTNVIAVGDEVVISENGSEQGVVEQVLPRRSILARPDVHDSHLKHVIVANVDQLLIVGSWREPHLWLELVDRYLISAERDNLEPIVCVNKIDLAANRDEVTTLLRPYRELGIDVIYTSIISGEGIDVLRERLIGSSTVLAGLSGVGKSSLLSTIQPGLNLRVGAVSEDNLQGQHTTTQALMTRLAAGGCVVDTPGIRRFGLSGLAKSELAEYYPEFAVHVANCRFDDCTHHSEPDCAVREAVRRGKIADWRYKNYLKLYGQL